MIEDKRHTIQAKHNLTTPFPIPTEKDVVMHVEMRKLDEQAKGLVTTDDVQRLQLEELREIRWLLERMADR